MNERCFGLARSGQCYVLNIGMCVGNTKCAFYKPRWMFARDRDITYVRISEMPTEAQLYFSSKYYGGKMPWLGDAVR